MGRKKKEIRLKEPVRIREKKIAGGNISLYLDIYQKGLRKKETLTQLQRSSTVILLHVMQLRFEKFRVGTTDFSERGADWRIECDSA